MILYIQMYTILKIFILDRIYENTINTSNQNIYNGRSWIFIA